jgi:hypothetical protein
MYIDCYIRESNFQTRGAPRYLETLPSPKLTKMGKGGLGRTVIKSRFKRSTGGRDTVLVKCLGGTNFL